MSIVSAHIVPHPPLIIPEVGRGEDKKIQRTIDAYHETLKAAAAQRPQTIVIITPHSVMYRDYIHISPGSSAYGDLGQFHAPNVRFDIEYDQEFADSISECAERAGISAGTLGEIDSKLDHGFTVPLYFLEQYLSNVRFVRVSISGLSYDEHYRFGLCIKEVAEGLNRRTVIIASGDLSHKLTPEGPYGYSPQGPDFDKKMTEIMDLGNFAELLDFDEHFCDCAGECGLRSFIIMSGALDSSKFTSKLLSYEGPFGVGYAVGQFTVCEDPYVGLARMTLENYIQEKSTPDLPPDLPDEMLECRAGVFVSLKKHGELRGCIGTITPVQNNIALEIIANAISAGTRDPRFSPVRLEELDHIVYSVDVLSEPERVSDKSQLDVNKYGVIVSRGRRRGLLLPMLEGVDTVEGQISIALSKAGIAPEEEYEMERFEVVRHT